MKKKVKEYLIVSFATFILALAFNLCFFPLKVVIGGSSGLSIIAEYYFNIEPAFVVLACYVGAFIVGYLTLGKKKIKNSIFGTFAYPFFIYVTYPLSNYMSALNLNASEYMIIVIAGAVVSGVAAGIVYKLEYTTGGSDIAAHIVNKYFGVTVGSANLIFNAIIVVMGGFVFGWLKVLYAILALYIMGRVTDKVLMGMSYSKAFYIVTSKVDEIEQYISDNFHQSITELESSGGYTNQGNQVLMCVVPTRDYFRLREGITLIDKDVFCVIMDAYEMAKRHKKA